MRTGPLCVIVIVCGYVFQIIKDFQMLGTYTFALAAGNTVFRLSSLFGKKLFPCQSEKSMRIDTICLETHDMI